MTELTAQELTDMRVIADDFFPDTCTIQTPSGSTGSMGGIANSYANTYTNVACRVDPMGPGDERLHSEALEGRSGWWLNIPYDQAVAITGRVIHDGVTYEIRSVVDTQSYRTIRRASLVRVN